MTRTLALALVFLPLLACEGDIDTDPGPPGESCEDDEADLQRPNSWTVASHCKGQDPDYDLLFDDTVVHRLDITVTAEDYAATMTDLDSLLGSSGGGPGGGGPGGGGVDVSTEPIFVPVTVDFGDKRWKYVGMRYKGNSSLRSSYQEGIQKLSFRLDFDEFEDDHPEIDDQRFYGFKKMTFSNGFNDPSLIRDKVAADIFRDGGVPAARGAFAAVHVDFGQGPVYFGLYTMIEDVSDELPDAQFADGSGNLYKPDGDGAELDTFVEAAMIKKTNEDAADFSDVIGLIDALNANTSGATWREGLEAVFDVDSFLTYLAINQAMVNWDGYGRMTHNYYLYADPSAAGRIVFVPWDLNEALLDRGNSGMTAGASDVMLDAVGADWPLIRRVLDDATYRAAYEVELDNGLAGAFAEDAVKARMQRYHDLIAPYAVGADGESAPYTFLVSDSDFDGSLTTGSSALFPHVESRVAAVEQALR